MYPQSYGQIPQDDPHSVTESSPNVSAMENLDAADPVSFNDLTEESIMRQLSEVLPYDDPQLLEALSMLNDRGNELFHSSPAVDAVTAVDDQSMVVPVGWSPVSSGAESFDELAIGASTSRSGVENLTSSPQLLGDLTLGLQPVNPSYSSWSVPTSFAGGYSPAVSTCGRVLPSLRKEDAINVTAVSSSGATVGATAAAGVGSGNVWMTSYAPSSSRSSSCSTSDSDNQTAVPDPRELGRKERRREQNRRAALKCRTRRKQAMNDMAKNFAELSGQRQQFANRISWLMAQIADMEKTLVTHEQSCHCTLRNNNNNSSSTSGS